MTPFPGSPRLVKGGIVVIDAETSAGVPAGRTAAQLSELYKGSKFKKQADQTYINFLSRGYPTIEDPIFPEDPRYDKHIIRRP